MAATPGSASLRPGRASGEGHRRPRAVKDQIVREHSWRMCTASNAKRSEDHRSDFRHDLNSGEPAASSRPPYRPPVAVRVEHGRLHIRTGTATSKTTRTSLSRSPARAGTWRSEEHTSELQSLRHL